MRLFVDAFFDAHVFEFAGFEDLAAFEALDEFGIFVTADDLNARMLTRLAGLLRLRGRL